MKITYFLRGLGIGIIFCALVLFAAYKTTPTTMSNEEIISKAKELGMVEGGKSDKQVDAALAKKEEEKKSTTETKVTTEETTTEEVTTEETTTEEVTTEEATTEETTTEAPTTEADNSSETVSFTISQGTYSENVAATLESLGVVKSASEFNKYLCDNGYADRLVCGSYNVTKGEDYYSIASKITR